MPRKSKKIRTKLDVNRPSQTAQEEQAKYEKVLPKPRHPVGWDKTLILDGHNLAYAAYYAYSNLSYKGKSVSVIFGMPQMVKSLLLELVPKKLVICWDGKKHPKRLELLPTYKSHREKNRDPQKRELFLKQINTVQKLFYRLGVPQAYNDAIEGDDMIYMVTKKERLTHKVQIVTSDKDFVQLIDFDTSLYHPLKRIPSSTFAFSAHYGVDIPQYVDLLCLLGDHSDDIPGIKGIGPVKAMNFLNQYYTIKDYLNDDDAYFPGLGDKKTLRKQIWRNRRLIDLALFHRKYNKKAKITYIRDRQFPSYNPEKYTQLCTKYNLKTLMTETFLKPFLKLQ